MVIASEAVSDWLAKGELLDRYYNPGNLFSHVHLVLTNDDRPDRDLAQRLVGSAELEIHNVPLPRGLFRRTIAYRPRLLRGWAESAVKLAARTQPDVVRCYGASLNVLLAAEIRRNVGVPYAVSLHINPDADVRPRSSGRSRVVGWALRAVEAHGLRNADIVLPVYESIIPYLERLGVSRYRVAYNMVNSSSLVAKDAYALHSPVRVISVGRQFDAKNPERLMRAVVSMEDVHLTLVGDGPLHMHLRNVGAKSGRPDVFTFYRSRDNAALCALLAEQDLFATHSEYWELSKAVIEALLTGLPVVLNARHGEPVPELEAGIALLVRNDESAWRDALRDLVSDDVRREALGRRGADHAWRNWSPEVTEATFVEIYESLLAKSPQVSAVL
jgi:glycosyltransferase involved in cell wall biosynthesis